MLSVDVSESLALDGVIAVMTAEDLPGAKKVGHIKKDWDVIIPVGGITPVSYTHLDVYKRQP